MAGKSGTRSAKKKSKAGLAKISGEGENGEKGNQSEPSGGEQVAGTGGEGKRWGGGTSGLPEAKGGQTNNDR